MSRSFGTRNVLVMLLTPIVRWGFRRTISVATVIECLKEAAVSVIAKELEISGVTPTISKISVATGLTRREVTRLYHETRSDEDVLGVVGRVLVQWEQDSRYRSSDGRARELSCKGRNSEFHQLVAKVSKDINPATVLFELIRIGSCERNADRVKLLRSIQFHTDIVERGYELLMRDINTEILAVEQNLKGDAGNRNLHLRTEFDNIFKDDLPQIRAWLLERGAAFHKETREFLSNYDQDLNPTRNGQAGAKVVLGAFSWTSEDQFGS